ncbi:MAG: signal peptidase II [Clostridiales bacterium]|nr:signal peptidase II [Clostridiales bacterium]
MLYAIVAVIILILDQAVKYWTTSNIVLNSPPKTFIPGIIDLTNVHNSGAAFGIFKESGRWFFVAMTLLFAVAVVYILSKNIIKGKLGRWTLVMVLAGGLGNCIDRIINGYVVDMFSFKFVEFAVFNVADIFVTVCGIIFCLYLLFHKEPDAEKPLSQQTSAPSRPLHTASERPVKKADYISQLKKPVVEGRRSSEEELAAKRAENSSPRQTQVSFTDWNVPAEEIKKKPFPSVKSSSPVNPEHPAQPASGGLKDLDFPADFAKKSSNSPKSTDLDFTLEDIIAEFKDK